MGGAKSWIQSIMIFIAVILLLSISKVVNLFTDYLWFDSAGFSPIFLISLQSKIFLFLAAALIFLIFAAVNLWTASKLREPKTASFPTSAKVLTLLILAVIIGTASSSKWLVVMEYLKQVPFGINDPIFMKDIAFYVFSLPFFLALWNFAMAVVVLTTAIVLADYMYSFIAGSFKPAYTQQNPQYSGPPSYSFDFKGFMSKLKRKPLVHVTLLASLIFLLLAVKHYLSLFSVMYSEKGIVVGAGYTDVVVFLPIVKIMIVLAVITAAVFYIWVFYLSKQQELKKRHILAYAVIIYILFSFIGPTFIPEIVQALKVTPNEINLEKPFIDYNIKFTKIAYGLSDVVETDFPVELGLSADILRDEPETIDNIRILDWRPLTETYKQTQEIRLYYDLAGIDIDRYDIGGKYTQVMLTARELDQSQLVENAKTWVNLHMVYTHGFGVVMSPVNSVTKEGLPNFFIKDIPPVYNVKEEGLRISKPQIYYGEKDNDYVLVNTLTPEFDFPKGSTNEYTHYDGKGGVTLKSFLRNLLMAARFMDVRILLSSDITPESRILFIRNIGQRISKITPFLTLDSDPYLVIDEGRLLWIQDAYTTSASFPYSQKYGPINYIRNPVKITVDAYDGTVTYYIINKNEPLMRTYARIFPGQFRSFDDMPEGLKKHVRYPTDLFKVQSDIYSIYHMDDATVFYNKEDAWQIPFEIYGVGQQVEVEPYYIIMKLPGQEKEEFVLMSSFTPLKKDNMISWFAARSDGDNYGKLLLYRFPKDKLVYGPLQIEAKFDQDSVISQQLTLWSQQGSSVTRGNLLVIPIRNSILYIEPMYIQAEKGKLPELKRVLVSDGKRVVMEKDIPSAFESLFGKAKKEKAEIPEKEEEKSVGELIKEAKNFYDSVLESMRNQDWAAIGKNIDSLGKKLEEISAE